MKHVLSGTLYSLLRYAPAFVGFVFLGFQNSGPNHGYHTLDVTIRLLTLFASWDVMTGLFFLWLWRRNNNQPNANGYGIATGLVALIALFILQVCRAQMAQAQFMIVLLALGFRGMVKGSLENNRTLFGMLCSLAAHSSFGWLSFSLFYRGIPPWQTIPLCIAIGSLVAATELSRYGEQINRAPGRSIAPVYRVLISLGPVIIITCSLLGLLEIFYAYLLPLGPLGFIQARRSTEEQPISRQAPYLSVIFATLTIIGLLVIKSYL